MHKLVVACLLAIMPQASLGAQCPDGTPPPCARRATRITASAPAPTSIAVLDFRQLSPDTSDAYLAEGLAEELTSRLGQVERITVKARAAVERLRGAGEMSTAELGRALSVAYLVSGSVRRAGSRLRVSVELLRATTGVQAWASQYDRDQADLLGIQEEVATAVTAAIVGRLLPAERTALATRPTRNPVAYDAYLRGQVALRARRNPSEAVRALRQATALDSGYADAFAALSMAYSSMFWSIPTRHDSLLVPSRAAADRAIALAPDRSDGHLALGYYYYHGFRDYRRALDELMLAQRASPNHPTVLSLLAYVARRQGRWDVTLLNLERVIALDPADTLTVLEMVGTLQHLRRWEEADAYLDRIGTDSAYLRVRALRGWGLAARGRLSEARSIVHRTPLDFRGVMRLASSETPSLALFVRLDSTIQDTIAATVAGPSRPPIERVVLALLQAFVHEARGRLVEARAGFESVRPFFEAAVRARPDDAEPRVGLAFLYATLGRFDEARREAQRATELLPISTDAMLGPIVVLQHAQVLVMAGDHDAAIDKLEYLLTIPAPLTRELLRLDPAWHPLRGNPRFQRLASGS